MLFASECVFWAYHSLIRRDQVCRKAAMLRKTQYWPLHDLELLQRRKLGELLYQAVTAVPYYRERFTGDPGELRRNPDLSCFGILDKNIIRKNFDALQHRDIAAMHAKKSSTSGSTGESLFFLLSQQDFEHSEAGYFRAYSWLKASPLEPQAVLWGARFDDRRAGWLKSLLKRNFKPFFFFSSYALTESQMEAFSQTLRQEKIRVITSYPSPLECFARFVEKHGYKFPMLKGIITSAEQLFPYQRELFERVFGCPVFNRYGAREFSCIAHECEKHEGLHVEAEHVWVEILDDDLRPCPAGTVGDLYITNLDNLAMPFIRYRIGDRASWKGAPCSCGRSLPLLERIDGRSFDLVRDAAGNVVSGTFWTLLVRYVSEEIRSFQVCQKTVDAITISLVAPRPLSGAEETLLRTKIKEKLPALTVLINYVDGIPLTRAGKHRFVLSEL